MSLGDGAPRCCSMSQHSRGTGPTASVPAMVWCGFASRLAVPQLMSEVTATNAGASLA